ESPQQLPDLFQTELRGLMATVGHGVSLEVEPRAGTVAAVLNELERTPAGRLKLPNLGAGQPVRGLVRVRGAPVPPATELCPTVLCRFRLAWDEPGCPGRQSLTADLHLPVVNAAAWESLPVNVEVKERAALLELARAKRRATACVEQHRPAGAARGAGGG